MTLEAIIFDVDGTLAETEELHRSAFNRAFVDAGLDWRWDQALYGRLLRVAGGKERIRHFVESEKRLRAAPEDVGSLIGALHRRKTARYAELVARHPVVLRPGIAELIAGARSEGVRLAIATTTSRANVDALLRATLGENGAGAFEVIASGESVPRMKPAPDVFHFVLEKLGLPPDRCLAIEDSENGLRAASSAGLVTLIAASQYARGENFTGAAKALASLDELVTRDGERGEVAPPSPGALIAAARALHREALESRIGDATGMHAAGSR